jgi:hypothetical protein
MGSKKISQYEPLFAGAIAGCRFKLGEGGVRRRRGRRRLGAITHTTWACG